MKDPNYIPRSLDLQKLLKSKSYFLLGARQTGKSSLIHNQLPNCIIYNLLDSKVFLDLSQNPKLIEQELVARQDKTTPIIVIDEIQKLPSLLNEAHLIIEQYKVHFLLTGSSARKLRLGGVNLLGGRARSRHLHPFTYTELGNKFDLKKALDIGLLPSIYFSDEPYEDLKAYAGDYLKEEIASEAIVRNISAFSRFLQVAALCNSQIINYTKIGNDAQVPKSTVQEYFQILFDTLIAFEVPAWKQSTKRKPVSTSKFYFFDIGIARFLQNQEHLKLKSPEAGHAFESYIAHELQSYRDYHGLTSSLCHWRTTNDIEVDFIFDNRIAIEVKLKETISERDLKGIKALKEEGTLERFLVVCLCSVKRIVDGIEIIPWQSLTSHLS